MKLYKTEGMSRGLTVIYNKQLDFIHAGKGEVGSREIRKSLKHKTSDKMKYAISDTMVIENYNENNIEIIKYDPDPYASLEKFIMHHFEYKNFFIVNTSTDFDYIFDILKDHDFLYHINHLNGSFATIGLKDSDSEAETCVLLYGLEKTYGLE